MSDDVFENNPPETERKFGFKEGISGNPGGRPKWLKGVVDGLKELHPAAKLRLASIIKDGADKDAAAAIRVLYDFTVPKPKQTHRVEGKGGDPLGLVSAEALVAFVTGKKEP